MNRPALAVLLAGCVLLLGVVAVGSVAGQDGTAERSLNATTVSPGETVEVTVTAELDGPASVDFADAWSPGATNTTIVSASFDRAGLSIAASQEVALFSDGEVTADAVEIVYTLSVPADAEPGTVYEWEPAQDGDGSFLSVGDDNRPITGDQQFEVAGGNDDGTDDGTDDGSDDGSDDGMDNGSDDGSGDGSGPGFGLAAVVLAAALLGAYSARRSEST